MVQLSTIEPIEYAIFGTSCGFALLALLAVLYALPWHRAQREASGMPDGSSRWLPRVLLELTLALWVLLQVLRLAVLWGPQSFAFPASVTQWTGAGWMCRIYLTAALGVAAPLCALSTLFLLASALSRQRCALGTPPLSPSKGAPTLHVLGRVLLCLLPIALAQGAIAWIGLLLTVDGSPLEQHPQALLSYFFAAFWYGTPQQCGKSSTNTSSGDTSLAPNNTTNSTASTDSSPADCTLCVFPAAASIAHAAWTLPFLIALWVVTSRLAAAAVNRRLKRRLRMFVAAWSVLALVGCACLGAAVVWGPFSWAHQGCWVGYYVTVVATAALLSLELVVLPVHGLRAAGKEAAAAWREYPPSPTPAQAVLADKDWPTPTPTAPKAAIAPEPCGDPPSYHIQTSPAPATLAASTLPDWDEAGAAGGGIPALHRSSSAASSGGASAAAGNPFCTPHNPSTRVQGSSYQAPAPGSLPPLPPGTATRHVFHPGPLGAGPSGAAHAATAPYNHGSPFTPLRSVLPYYMPPQYLHQYQHSGGSTPGGDRPEFGSRASSWGHGSRGSGWGGYG